MYVNTQSLDAWEPEAAARGALEESPKKDLFDMSKPPGWGVWCQTCCRGAEPCWWATQPHATALAVPVLAKPRAALC